MLFPIPTQATAITVTEALWRLVSPVADASEITTRYGSVLVHPSSGQVAIDTGGEPLHVAPQDTAASAWVALVADLAAQAVITPAERDAVGVAVAAAVGTTVDPSVVLPGSWAAGAFTRTEAANAGWFAVDV